MLSGILGPPPPVKDRFVSELRERIDRQSTKRASITAQAMNLPSPPMKRRLRGGLSGSGNGRVWPQAARLPWRAPLA
jgi:hypothetical protein